MGLDWNPGPRPKKEYEDEFERLWKKLQNPNCWFKKGKEKRFSEITETAFDTLNAPAVGKDPETKAWVVVIFERRVDKSITFDEFEHKMNGFRVLDLVPKCDGIPMYSNGSPGGYVEAYSFRGEFLKDCSDIMGKMIFESAWESKLPEETVVYGRKLINCANEFAEVHGIPKDYVLDPNDLESNVYKADVLMAAGKWCVYWGSRGHWLEAYY